MVHIRTRSRKRINTESIISPADSRSPDPELDLARPGLGMRLPDHMHFMLLVVSTSEVDAIVPLLQLREVLLVEDLEVWVLEDLEGVEPGFVVGLVLDGEGGGRGDDHDCECVECLSVYVIDTM
jgi:hypothetical protein